MPIYIDKQYVNLLSTKLSQFSWKADGTATFRCPYCGDSKRSKIKKRGYVYPDKKQDRLKYKCHNCQRTNSILGLLKDFDQSLYNQYVFDVFKKGKQKQPDQKEEQRTFSILKKSGKPNTLKTLKSVKNLPEDHPCKQYVIKRKIPEKHWNKLFYTENYCKWINEHVEKNKFSKVPVTDPRLVIPFMKNGEPYAYQGRYIGTSPKAIRYITIHPGDGLLIYGLDGINMKRPVKILEGPIDSLFLDNAIAVAGSSMEKLITKGLKNGIFIFDNEPRSKEICSLIEKVITNGASVVIWPTTMKQKDINDMILSGYSQKNIEEIIKNNTCSGLQAMIKFNDWKRV